MKRFISCILCFLLSVLFTGLKAQEDDFVYHTIENMPQFIGGQEALNKWLEDNIRPVCGCRGRVIVKFVVIENGAVRDAQVLKESTNPKQNEEALRLVRSMPAWTPGRTRGKAVKCFYTIPINFNSPLAITDNGATITGKVDCCPDEYWEWTLDKKLQSLSVAGEGKISWDKRWDKVSSLQLGDGVSDIYFIRKFDNIKKIQVSQGNKKYASVGGVLTTKTKDTLLVYPSGQKKRKYTIPAGIKCITYDAFDKAQIDTLVISSDVRDINENAFERANIKCFVVKNNPAFSVRYGVLCKNDGTCTFYFPSTQKDIPTITAAQFEEKVIECTQGKCVFKGKKPVAFILNSETCRQSVIFTKKMRILYEEFKDEVDFYQVDGANSENLKIKKLFNIYEYPTLCMLNGESQEKPFYLRVSKGNIMTSQDNYDKIRRSIEEMLSGATTSPTQK